MIYLSVSEDDQIRTRVILQTCIQDVSDWMSCNFLLLNVSKTEFVSMSSRRFSQDSCPLSSIAIGEELVSASSSARNLGVLFDSQLSMETHISIICRSAYSHLRNINRIRKSLSQSDTEKLVHAFISSRLDSCNSLLSGLPVTKIKPLIRVQNAAARLVTRARKYDHITDIFIKLHWLPVVQRINFKLLLLVYKSLYGFAPNYLCELIKFYVPSRSLRSESKFLIKTRQMSGKKSKVLYKDRAFENLGPKLFNELPLFVRSSPSVDIFKSRLKTHLFKCAFNI